MPASTSFKSRACIAVKWLLLLCAMMWLPDDAAGSWNNSSSDGGRTSYDRSGSAVSPPITVRGSYLLGEFAGMGSGIIADAGRLFVFGPDQITAIERTESSGEETNFLQSSVMWTYKPTPPADFSMRRTIGSFGTSDC